MMPYLDEKVAMVVLAGVLVMWVGARIIAPRTQTPYQSMTEAQGKVMFLGLFFVFMSVGALVLFLVCIPLRLIWWIGDRIDKHISAVTSA